MSCYLLLFVIGSIITQGFILFFIGKNVHFGALVTCIGITFFAMLAIEIWATGLGLWEWSSSVTLMKIGNIPIEEMMLYVTSAVTTVVLFEFFLIIVSRFICK